MAFLQKIEALNNFRPENYVRLDVCGVPCGAVRKAHVNVLEDYAPHFSVQQAADSTQAGRQDAAVLSFQAEGASCSGDRASSAEQAFAERTRVMEDIAADLERRGLLAYPLKSEPFPVVPEWDAESLMNVDRGAMAFFGFRAFGVHMNGYVRRRGGLFLWLGRRGPGVKVWSGRLDQMVAGGQPADLSLEENLAKEAMEEAQLSSAVTAQAQPCGRVSYALEMQEGVRRDTIFVYDLEVPEDVTPIADGSEVGTFELMPVSEVIDILRTSDTAFKPNAAPVIIDFLIRHGVLTQENTPDYDKIRQGLVRPLSF